MAEYGFSNYGIFDDAVSTTNTVSSQTTDFQSSVSDNNTIICDDNVFMGPVADFCRESFLNLNTDVTTLVENYNTISSYLITAAEKYLAGDKDAANDILRSVTIFGGEFVNYYQTDYNNPYGDGTIANAGCGPTSMAMVLTYLTGDEVTPVETAAYGDNNGYYVRNKGTSWAYFDAIANEYGVNCTQSSVSADNILSALKEDKTVIMAMGPGTFTRRGHFIVLTGLNADGSISVADPNSVERSQTTYDVSVFVNEGSEMWSFC